MKKFKKTECPYCLRQVIVNDYQNHVKYCKVRIREIEEEKENKDGADKMGNSTVIEAVMNNGERIFVGATFTPQDIARIAKKWEEQIDITSTIGLYTNESWAEGNRLTFTNDSTLYKTPFYMLRDHLFIKKYTDQDETYIYKMATIQELVIGHLRKELAKAFMCKEECFIVYDMDFSEITANITFENEVGTSFNYTEIYYNKETGEVLQSCFDVKI